MPYLFNEVFLSLHSGHRDTAELVIDHFGFHIKTLTFSTVYYEEFSRTNFERRVNRGISKPLKADMSNLSYRDHLHHAYGEYRKVRSDQMEFLEKGKCHAYLCRALRRLPNLQRLALKDLGSGLFDRIDNWYVDGLAKSLEPCSVMKCQLSPSEHLDFLAHPKSGFLNAETSSWNLAMLAWRAVGSPVRELAVESYTCLPLRSFVNTVQTPWKLRLFFQGLTKLRLDLLIETEPSQNYFLNNCSFQEGRVSLALAGAKNLQCLDILTNYRKSWVESKPMTPFQSILGTCQFPKLRSLKLWRLHSTMEELLGFFEASKQLQKLTLCDHRIYSGTWEQAADWMRSSLRGLEEVHLGNLHDDMEIEGPFGGFTGFTDCSRSIQDFFFRHGPNPLSEKMRTAHRKDLQDRGEEV